MSKSCDGTTEVIVIGIPNSGKSTLVGRLSGAFIRTANYPGTTVTINEINYKIGNTRLTILDLPGTYSLRPSMVDEEVAAKEVLLGDYDGVVVVGSAISPKQTFYLLIQVLELGKPTILVLNMTDIARRRGIHYRVNRIMEVLGIPVIETVAVSNTGLRELRDYIVKIRELSPGNTRIVNYDRLEKYINSIVNAIGVPRGVAVEILAGNPLLSGFVNMNEKLKIIIDEARKEVPNIGEYIVLARWKAVKDLVNEFVEKQPGQGALSRLDSAFLNSRYGFILSILLLFAVAEVIFLALEPLVDIISNLIDAIPMERFLSNYVTNDLLRSLMLDGIWNGATVPIEFIPYVFGVALLIAFIEDSGLIVRITFPLERWLRRVGIPSRGLIYLIAGSGCNVPAIVATRAMPSTRDRVLTALMIPYIPCTARFVVIALIAAAVIPQLMGLIVIIPYVVAFIGVTIVSSLSRVRIRLIGKPISYVYELPPLTIPLHRAFIKKVWYYTYEFIVRAGLLIFTFIIIIWLLSISGPRGLIGPAALTNPDLLRYTWLGVVGGVMGPLLAPIGVPWQISASLVYGYVFKEVVLSTLALLYGISEHGLTNAIVASLSIPSALALMVFVTFYSPCIATLIMERRIVGLKLTIINTVLQFVLALVMAYFTYYLTSILLTLRW
ncbi:MAG: GTP-binding protein [Vulcanisaeta sp. JCHS_4]|jgi:small GTP-binding protein domain|nr:MAG: GTP-binding protein [Vulcanisaeta sp. JCHS_4]